MDTLIHLSQYSILFILQHSFIGTWNETVALESKVASLGIGALALWVKEQQAMDPSSHRKFFRERLNPRTVESYQYGKSYLYVLKNDAPDFRL